MAQTDPRPCTLFVGDRLVARGAMADVARAARLALDADPEASLLIFEDATGRTLDVDLRGSADEVAARLAPVIPSRGPGRPKLGVTAREVTLLPRHWEWLAAQPGGASTTLRKLVEAASKQGGERECQRRAQEVAYRFMTTLAGDRPGYEEACRALFAGDLDGLAARAKAWPADIRGHTLTLATGARGDEA